MKANIIFVAATLALMFAAGAVNLTEPITVSNVRFSQARATQRVTVNYALANQGEPAWVTMDVLTNGATIGMQHVSSVSGDISRYGLDMVGRGPVADDGLEKTIVWDAHRDWRGNLGSNVTVEVAAWYTNSPPGVYMVVDLSEGPTAVRYPVSLSTAVPDPTDLSCVSPASRTSCGCAISPPARSRRAVPRPRRGATRRDARRSIRSRSRSLSTRACSSSRGRSTAW